MTRSNLHRRCSNSGDLRDGDILAMKWYGLGNLIAGGEM